MVRYSRRRGGGMRRTRRKRSYGKTIRRSRMTIRRIGKTFRRRAGVNRRWKTYSFTRMCDLYYENFDPETGSPTMVVNSMGSVSPLSNMVTPAVIDPTYHNAHGCSSWSAALIFKLSNLPNVQEFISSSAAPTGLFEEYKIKGVSVEIDPYYKNKDLVTDTYGINSGGQEQRTYPDPTMFCVTDHDSSGSINWPFVMEASGVKKLTLNRAHKLWIKPTAVAPLASTPLGGSVFDTFKKSPWISNRDTNVQHFGLRFLMTDWPGYSDNPDGVTEGDAVQFGVRIRMRYYFKVRGVI